MSHHPAPDELLLDYAAGTLPEGPALAVALHLALDPAARQSVAYSIIRRPSRRSGGSGDLGGRIAAHGLAGYSG